MQEFFLCRDAVSIDFESLAVESGICICGRRFVLCNSSDATCCKSERVSGRGWNLLRFGATGFGLTGVL